MATSIAVLTPAELGKRRSLSSVAVFPALLTAGLTAAALAIHGYHPYAEDGGVYLPGVKYLLNRSLYPEGTGFVTEHLRYSVFAPVIAGLVRSTGLELETVLLLLYLVSIWATLGAGWMLAARSFERLSARAGAVTLLAVWLTLPVAGTSLMLVDPYLTARSFSTPLTLLAMVAALDHLRGTRRNWQPGVLCLLALLAAGLMHPLMAAWAGGYVLVLVCLHTQEPQARLRRTAAVCLSAVAVAGVICLWPAHETAVYQRVVATRPYWFLACWRWFELTGLAAPLLILSSVAHWRRWASETLRLLAQAAVVCGATAVLVAWLFAQENASSHALARLQPLRVFGIVYCVMILALGGLLGELLLQQRWPRWILCFGLLSGVMTGVERRTFPGSPHVELAGQRNRLHPQNAWEAAFVWIRTTTPNNAVFALPGDYVGQPGEDAQGFRAIAERSALADYSKDGGEAAITPTLAEQWAREQDAVTGPESMSDAERARRLRPLGATWIILPGASSTTMECPYHSSAVQVCRLP